MVEDYGELFLLPLKLLIVVDKESTVNFPHKSIGILATTCKFFPDAVYGNKIVIICYSFASLTSTITNLLLSRRRWSAATGVFSFLCSSIRLCVSRASRALWCPFGTCPTASFTPERRTLLMAPQCSSILSGELHKLSFVRSATESYKQIVLSLGGRISPTVREDPDAKRTTEIFLLDGNLAVTSLMRIVRVTRQRRILMGTKPLLNPAEYPDGENLALALNMAILKGTWHN